MAAKWVIDGDSAFALPAVSDTLEVASGTSIMSDYIVRYGAMRFLGVFSPAAGREYRRGTNVVARTDRGLEIGEVLCEATEEATRGINDPGAGQILREMTPEDCNEQARLRKQAKEQFDICRKNIERLGLKMQLVDVEHLFGGERIVVYYLAENRVDFRELVRSLAGEFQTRIEMRQIGVRDEAKLLADYGDCGGPVCCNTHLVEMPPVSMRMAKLQKATLDPTKISGRCGRLKCCLRYEYENYEQAARSPKAETPKEGGQEQPPAESAEGPTPNNKDATESE
jgi:cell fate regulator YaaT (PSP1 superfamily)